MKFGLRCFKFKSIELPLRKIPLIGIEIDTLIIILKSIHIDYGLSYVRGFNSIEQNRDYIRLNPIKVYRKIWFRKRLGLKLIQSDCILIRRRIEKVELD